MIVPIIVFRCDVRGCLQSKSVAIKDTSDPEHIARAESQAANDGWLTVKSGKKHYCPIHAGRKP